MASVFPIRNLHDHLGLSYGAATDITYDQEIYNLDKLKLLHDNDFENLCESICRPGVTVVDKTGVDMPNPVIPFSLWADMNLSSMTYYLWYPDKISSTIGAANVILQVVRLIISLKELQEAHEHPSTAPKFNDKYMVKTLNTIVDYLHGYLGESNIPLDYVVCYYPSVTIEADDPSVNYKTIKE